MKITDKMVEAAARAAFDTWWDGRGPGREPSWLQTKDRWLKEARAALTAVAPYMVPEEAVRGEDWENAAHELFWKTGKEDLFELLRAQAHDEAEERHAAKASFATPPNQGGGDG